MCFCHEGLKLGDNLSPLSILSQSGLGKVQYGWGLAHTSCPLLSVALLEKQLFSLELTKEDTHSLGRCRVTADGEGQGAPGGGSPF